MKNNGRGKLKTAGKVLAWTAGVWIVLLVIVQISLSPAVLTRIVDKYANEYIDADMSFESIGISMFSSFPNVCLNMDNCAVTYGHDKFDGCIDPDIVLQKMGRGEKDTLAVFENFSVKINPFALAAWKLKITELSLCGPRIFANTYTDGRSNWDIFPESDEEGTGDTTPEEDCGEDSDESGTSLPRIELGRIVLDQSPTIVYTSSPDKTGTFIRLKRASFAGRLDRESAIDKKVELKVDSLFASGRIGADTLISGIDLLRITGRNGNALRIELAARAFAGTDAFGRLAIPVRMEGEAGIVRDSLTSFDIKGIEGNIAWIPFRLTGTATPMPGSFRMDIGLDIENLEFSRLIKSYGAQLVSKDLLQVKTDAVFNAHMRVDGSYVYESGELPAVTGVFEIPQSRISVDGTGIDGQVALAGDISTDAKDRINVDLRKMLFSLDELADFGGSLQVEDVTGNDMLLKPDLHLEAQLGNIGKILPDSLGIDLKGNLSGGIKGRARLSQLDIYKLPETELLCFFKSDSLVARMQTDSIELYAKGINLNMETRMDTLDAGQKRKSRLLDIGAGIDTMLLQYGPAMTLRGNELRLAMKNDAGILNNAGDVAFYPMKGTLSAKRLSLRDCDSTSIGLSRSRNSFRITHLNGDSQIPVLSLMSKNRSVRLKSSDGRVFARNLGIDLSARMTTKERQLRRNRMLDSLALVYPDIPRDSLMKVAFRNARSRRAANALPGERDFAKKDLDFRIDGSLRKYFTEWGVNGRIGAERVRLVTPLLPLENTVNGIDASFNNDRIDLNSFKLNSGGSALDFTGHISGLRRALLGRGRIKVDAKLVAEKLDCNELLAAWAAGQKLAEDKAAHEGLDDDEFEAALMKAGESADAEATDPLIVIPANVEADIAVESYDIEYSCMTIDWLSCNLKMKNRCLQIYNTMASANMGNMFFEGYYTTPDKKNIGAGFNFSLVDVTAGEVFDMIPQIKEVVPMLSSFDGLLDCEIAGTAAIDTTMSIVMPSVKGIMRIGGKNLTLAQDEDLQKITRLLRFKDRKDMKIDKMTVEGQIADSRLEVFPFILDIDRYRLAMSGIQNMDMSFRYSISVIKSPLIFKFGVDLYGQDFDHLKFKIGKAKYRNARSVPAFTATINQEKLNLSNSIRNIFERSLAGTAVSGGEAIERKKAEIGYVAAVDMETKELSETEMKGIEERSAQAEPAEAGADGDTDTAVIAEDQPSKSVSEIIMETLAGIEMPF